MHAYALYATTDISNYAKGPRERDDDTKGTTGRAKTFFPKIRLMALDP
jgi:hypothetical protein